jgi:hypothetical protein
MPNISEAYKYVPLLIALIACSGSSHEVGDGGAVVSGPDGGTTPTRPKTASST